MMEYKGNFVIGIVSSLVMQLSGIITIWIIIEQINEIYNWGFYEIAFLYSLVAIAVGVNQMLMDSFWNIGYVYIQRGHFDIILPRPVSPFFQMAANRLSPEGFGQLLVGLIVFLMSIKELQLSLGVSNILMLIVFILSGIAILAAITLIGASLNFWLIGGNSVLLLIFSLHNFAKYPLVVFPRIIRMLLTFGIPFAFISFYPASYFLNMEYYYWSFLSPIIAVALCFAAKVVWTKGIQHYEGTGS